MVVETSVFKYKIKTELGKVLGDFLSLPPIETKMGYFVPIGTENNIHRYFCSKNATLSIFRNQMQSISLKGDGGFILNVSLSICTEGSSPMLLSAPVFF